MVPVYNELDVLFVGCLSGGVGVETIVVGVAATVSIQVSVDSAKGVEVVEKRENKLEAALFGSGHGIVETGDPVPGIVVEELARGVEYLVIDIVRIAGIVDGAETPDTNHFEAGLEKK